jgi:hypothetical protein
MRWGCVDSSARKYITARKRRDLLVSTMRYRVACGAAPLKAFRSPLDIRQPS